MSQEANRLTEAALGEIDDPSIPVLTERILDPAADPTAAPPASLAPEAGIGSAASEQASSGPAPGQEALPPRDASDATRVTGPAAATSPSATDASEMTASTDVTLAPVGLALRVAQDETGSVEAADRDVLSAQGTDHGAAQRSQPRRDADNAPAESFLGQEKEPSRDVAQVDALRAAVLNRVEQSLPDQVTAAVRERMQPAIDRAMAQLSEDVQAALRVALKDLVEQALREERARRVDPPPS